MLPNRRPRHRPLRASGRRHLWRPRDASVRRQAHLGYQGWCLTAFLELGSRTSDRAVAEGDLGSARDIAVTSLDVDPENADLERRLVWLYWHLGARAAASAQFDHLVARERADGLDPLPLELLVTTP